MYLQKWPRHYAAEIMPIRDPKARAEALARVPTEFRDWVAELVKCSEDIEASKLKARASRPKAPPPTRRRWQPRRSLV